MPFRAFLLNRLNLCDFFFEESVREGGVVRILEGDFLEL